MQNEFIKAAIDSQKAAIEQQINDTMRLMSGKGNLLLRCIQAARALNVGEPAPEFSREDVIFLRESGVAFTDRQRAMGPGDNIDYDWKMEDYYRQIVIGFQTPWNEMFTEASKDLSQIGLKVLSPPPAPILV